jgi:hypothetical protein
LLPSFWMMGLHKSKSAHTGRVLGYKMLAQAYKKEAII